MVKKFTRKDAEALCLKITKEFLEDEKHSSNLLETLKLDIPKIDIIAVNQYVENAEHVGDMYCTKCGHVGRKVLPGTYYSTWRYTCPVCGTSKLTTNGMYKDYQKYGFAFKFDDWYAFVIYSISYFFNKNTEREWYLNNVNTKVSLNIVGAFHEENGAFLYDVPSDKMTYDNNSSFLSVWNTFENLDTPGTMKNNMDISVKELVTKVKDWKVNKDKATGEKKTKSKAGVLEEMRLKYKSKAKCMPHVDFIMFYLLSNKNNKREYQGYCTKCNHTFVFEKEDHDDMIECPHCKLKVDPGYGSSCERKNFTFAVFESTNLPENDLLMKIYRTTYLFRSKEGFSESTEETQRIFFGKKITVYNRTSSGAFNKGTIRDIDYDVATTYMSARENCFSGQTNEDVVEAIKNSCLKYSGVLESYGLGDERYTKYRSHPNISYLLAWYKNPAIEKVLKSNLTNILRDMIKDPELFPNENTISKILCVNEKAMHIVKKIGNVTRNDLNAINALFNADNNLTYETFLEFKNANFAPMYLLVLKQKHNVSFKKALEYLQIVYDNQCIEKNDAISIWTDYLSMASALKIDLSDKSRMFPSSLKKEHDVAMFAYRAVKEDVDKALFAEQAKTNAVYEYQYQDLIAIVPKTPEDIVEEATRQRNCLRSYIERVKNGQTVVVFIRKKDEPEKTYVTAEILGGRLTQLKGYCNSNPRNKELMEFVEKWSKATGFTR